MCGDCAWEISKEAAEEEVGVGTIVEGGGWLLCSLPMQGVDMVDQNDSQVYQCLVKVCSATTSALAHPCALPLDNGLIATIRTHPPATVERQPAFHLQEQQDRRAQGTRWRC